MIVRVVFNDHTMLFGNSYKPWHMQFDEYAWICERDGVSLKLLDVGVSHSKWVSWGGLKWCPEENIQQQLNREGCQSDDPDNLKPRQYHKMNFKSDKRITNKVKSILKIP